MTRRRALICGLLLALCGLALTPYGCSDAINSNGNGNGPQPRPPQRPKLLPREGMAFRMDAAFEHVVALVSDGARTTGSPALHRARSYIIDELDSCGVQVDLDFFDANYPRGTRPGINIIATLPGARPEVLVIGAHYDTKDMPDFVGANDGATAPALLIELAYQLSLRSLPMTVKLVFFDAEEAEVGWDPPRDGLLGSTHLAELWRKTGELENVRALVLVDLIGDRDLNLKTELNSTGWLRRFFEQRADEMGYLGLFSDGETRVDDDHIPFLKRGVAAVDLIDFNYGPENRYWHSVEDNLTNVCKESVGIIGDLVLESIDPLAEKLLR